jgi:hypothetical protein
MVSLIPKTIQRERQEEEKRRVRYQAESRNMIATSLNVLPSSRSP